MNEKKTYLIKLKDLSYETISHLSVFGEVKVISELINLVKMDITIDIADYINSIESVINIQADDEYVGKLYQRNMMLIHECKECGFKGEVQTSGRKIQCPQCNTINDFG